MKKILTWLVPLGIISCLLFICYKIRDQICVAQTNNRLALIQLTAHRTLWATNWQTGYDLAYKTKQEFPEIPVENSKILDYWGNPIRWEIKTKGSKFELKLVSAGTDGMFGTKDDLIKNNDFDQEK